MLSFLLPLLLHRTDECDNPGEVTQQNMRLFHCCLPCSLLLRARALSTTVETLCSTVCFTVFYVYFAAILTIFLYILVVCNSVRQAHTRCINLDVESVKRREDLPTTSFEADTTKHVYNKTSCIDAHKST